MFRKAFHLLLLFVCMHYTHCIYLFVRVKLADVTWLLLLVLSLLFVCVSHHKALGQCLLAGMVQHNVVIAGQDAAKQPATTKESVLVCIAGGFGLDNFGAIRFWSYDISWDGVSECQPFVMLLGFRIGRYMAMLDDSVLCAVLYIMRHPACVEKATWNMTHISLRFGVSICVMCAPIDIYFKGLFHVARKLAA